MSVQPLTLRHDRTEHRLFFACADLSSEENFLHESEKKILAGFKFAAKREGFLLGRLAAKRALGALLAEPDLRRIEIRSGAYGQPIVHHARAGTAEVTVSHSHGLAVALAYPGDQPMGIDLESVLPESAATVIGELQMSEAEQKWLAAANIDQATACGILWTAREALGKALRIGLNCPLGVLSLNGVQSAGEGKWGGEYVNFPHCRCLAQVAGGRVLSLALPKAAELSVWPVLH